MSAKPPETSTPREELDAIVERLDFFHKALDTASPAVDEAWADCSYAHWPEIRSALTAALAAQQQLEQERDALKRECAEWEADDKGYAGKWQRTAAVAMKAIEALRTLHHADVARSLQKELRDAD